MMDKKADLIERRRLLLGSGSLGLAAMLGRDAKAAADTAATVPSPPSASRAAASAATATSATPVERAFVRITEGLVHYRYLDARSKRPALPILMCHASPRSSEYFAAFIQGLASNRLVLAPDTLGYGDSAAPSPATPDLAYYADATVRALDALKIERVDFYGAHTGAQIGCEIAVRHPDRIRRLALDGVPLFSADFKKEALERYAPEVKPDAWGGHLAWAWNNAVEGAMFWPHYAHDAAHLLTSSTLTPEQLHHGVMDILKVLPTWHLGFRAAFRQDVHALLPKITQQTLVMSIARDPLHVYLDEAAALIANSKRLMIDTAAGGAGKLGALQSFFNA